MFRVAPCILLLAGLCFGPTGCSIFKKNAKEAPPPAARAGGKEPVKFPGSGDPIKESSATAEASGEVGGLLAGTVFDSYNNHPRDAFVRYVDLDEPKQDEVPVDVAVSPEGYFTIRGLKPNHHYKVVARAKDGSRMLAGTTYTKAPNIHVVIRLNEDNANGNIPPIPGAPVYTPKGEKNEKPEKPEKAEPSDKADEKKTSQTGNEQPGAGVVPAWGPAGPANVGGNIPELPTRPIQVSNPPQSQGWVPGVAVDTPGWPPVVKIPPPVPDGPRPGAILERPTPLPAGPVSPPPPETPQTVGPTRVPSCVLVGKKLVNLALNDVNQQPWEFRTNRKGKLVLFDFWGTMCVPCRETIPHLRILQSQYGTVGLEVVGIAYEGGGSVEDQARRVAAVGQRLQINYRMLLGGGSQCPVRSNFNIRAIPTLILVDENGWIVWRHEGRPDRNQIEELELIIKRRLGV